MQKTIIQIILFLATLFAGNKAMAQNNEELRLDFLKPGVTWEQKIMNRLSYDAGFNLAFKGYSFNDGEKKYLVSTLTPTLSLNINYYLTKPENFIKNQSGFFMSMGASLNIHSYNINISNTRIINNPENNSLTAQLSLNYRKTFSNGFFLQAGIGIGYNPLYTNITPVSSVGFGYQLFRK